MTEFEKWFSGDFQRTLRELPEDRSVLSTGFPISLASWDRRAGYLVWKAMGEPKAKWVEELRRGGIKAAPMPVRDDPDDLLSPAAADGDLGDLL